MYQVSSIQASRLFGVARSLRMDGSTPNMIVYSLSLNFDMPNQNPTNHPLASLSISASRMSESADI